jgi:hypothetical protein
MNISDSRHPATDSPGSQEPGLRRFWGQGQRAHRTPKAFITRLLSVDELERVRELLSGPQRFAKADRRLMDLGLAVIVQGRVVATQTARASLWRERYELRRGSDVRRLAVVGFFEADSAPEALTKAFALARRHVGPYWGERLARVDGSDHWMIYLPPPRAWLGSMIRPYVLELHKIKP